LEENKINKHLFEPQTSIVAMSAYYRNFLFCHMRYSPQREHGCSKTVGLFMFCLVSCQGSKRAHMGNKG